MAESLKLVFRVKGCRRLWLVACSCHSAAVCVHYGCCSSLELQPSSVRLESFAAVIKLNCFACLSYMLFFRYVLILDYLSNSHAIMRHIAKYNMTYRNALKTNQTKSCMSRKLLTTMWKIHLCVLHILSCKYCTHYTSCCILEITFIEDWWTCPIGKCWKCYDGKYISQVGIHLQPVW